MDNIALRTADAWGDYIEAYVGEGWQPFLLTFMFEPLSGSRAAKMAQMAHFLEQAYALFVTRVVRKPRTAAARGLAPIWLCAPDLPVYKRQKQSLRDVVVNDGLHYHVILLLPPWSRLWDVVAHFAELRPIYLQRAALERVDVKPILDRHRYVAGYGWKSILKGRFDVGDGFVLPRALTELEGAGGATRGSPEIKTVWTAKTQRHGATIL